MYNISMMNEWLRCPQYSYNRNVLRREHAARRKPVPLEVGTIFHEEMAMRLTAEGRASGDPCPSWFTVSQAARDVWFKHKLWLPLNAFEIPEGWEIIGIERHLQSGWLEGRLDALIKYNGKYWSVQWKTYEDDLLTLQEKVRLSHHEAAYQWLAERNGYTPWGGTILGACQKLPSYRMAEGVDGRRRRVDVTDEMRTAALTLHFLARSPERQARMVDDITHSLRLVDREIQGTIRRNYDHCWGRAGFSRCQYFDVCHNGAVLDGPEFVTIEARY